MKRIICLRALLSVGTVLIVVIFAITFGLGGDLGLSFGYYGKYNIVQREVEESPCFGSIDSSLANEDIALKYFAFTIRTRSHWQVELFFLSDMDVQQVCERPKGILLHHPIKEYQAYSLEFLSATLSKQGVELRNLSNILCNLDELIPVFNANFDNDEIPYTTDILNGYSDYLVIDNIAKKGNEISTPDAVKYPVSSPLKNKPDKHFEDIKLQNFEFDVVTLDSKGQKKSKKMQAPFYLENLGDDIKLDMVQIPAGRFEMGTSSSEIEAVAHEYNRYSKGVNVGFYVWNEHPQHSVTVPSFFMSKFEITQAQWRAVAQLPKVSRDIASDPSELKGDDLPVNSISWEDAVEFCERLSNKTGRKHRLPTEAEWEYACRAGTTTPFHFGETLPSELANYNGREYGSNSWSITSQEPTPAGSFGFANAFGLYDMHGNLAEWCLDIWHDNYTGSPVDGSGWNANGNDLFRVTRGGSWLRTANDARAACRGMWAKISAASYIGFRVVAVVGN